MISFAAPVFLYVGIAAAAAIVALHVLASKKPRVGLLPTARFFPDVPARATAITMRLSDLWLLLLRVATVLVIGTAFARPTVILRRESVSRIVVESRGSISAALIEALRIAARDRDKADSFDLTIISRCPLSDIRCPMFEEYDRATPAIRAMWPGRIRFERVDGPAAVVARPMDARVEWADSTSSALWQRRGVVDTVGAFGIGNLVLIAPFERRWRLADTARVVARWVDGEPAIVERRSDTGCVRSVAVTLPTVGDFGLRPDVVAFYEWLRQPCGRPVIPSAARDLQLTPADPSAASRPQDDKRLAAASELPDSPPPESPWTVWLLAFAAVLALGELRLRRRYAFAQ